MEHKIFPVSESLSPFIMSYWELKSPKELTPQKNTIIPDGTMKMIFHCAWTYRHYFKDGMSEILPRSFIISQLTKPYIVEPLWDTDTFIVRFHPHTLISYICKDIYYQEDTAMCIKKIFWKKWECLEKKILDAISSNDRIKIVEEFLSGEIYNTQNIDFLMQKTLDSIISFNEKYSIEDILKRNNLSRKQLERRFSAKIGLRPKQFIKIIRIQTVLKGLLNQEYTTLTDAAYKNKFYDQAHFIKDFKEFTGISPKDFYGDSLKMSLIFEDKA